MLRSQEGVGEPQRKPCKFTRSQAHGMSLLVLLEREEEESRLIYPRGLGCDRLVPQPLSKGRGGFYSVGASGMNRLSTPW